MAFTFTSDTESLTFTDLGVASEMRYIPTGTTFGVNAVGHNFSNYDTASDYPNSISINQISEDVDDITYTYDVGKTSVMRVTSHARFIEFELQSSTGALGLMALLYLEVDGLRSFNEIYFNRPQVMDIGGGFFACIMAANYETRISGIYGVDYSAFYAASPVAIPPHPSYSRNQQFAFFICPQADLDTRLKEVEDYFNLPYASLIKDEAESENDYLFLLDQNAASNQDVIDLCADTGLSTILLYMGVWSDYTAADAPFKLLGGAVTLVNALQAAGLEVGIHAYLHLVPDNGYYHVTYPAEVSANAEGGWRCFTWITSLPETAASEFASRVVNDLGADWAYLDGSEVLWETGGVHVDTYDGYLRVRMAQAFMQAMENEGVMPVPHQQSGAPYSCYHYISRDGQTDYWDGWPLPGTTPTTTIDDTIEQAPYRRLALFRPDLGWFGNLTHVDGGPDRATTWTEWCYMSDAAVEHNIPIGIRANWDDYDGDALEAQITLLLEAATAHRNNAIWHGYIGLENLNLNAGDWASLQTSCQAFGPVANPQPANVNHWLEIGDDAIYEALFDGIEIAIFNFRDLIADLLSVARAAVTYAMSAQTYDTTPTTIVTYTNAGTDYIKLLFLDGPNAAWANSGDECRAYIATW